MKMTKQRLMGFALVAISILLLLLASTGETLSPSGRKVRIEIAGERRKYMKKYVTFCEEGVD